MRSLALAAILPWLVACAADRTTGSAARMDVPEGQRHEVLPSPDGPRGLPQNSFEGAGESCANLLAFRGSADQTQFAVVQLDREQLDLLAAGTTRIDLGTVPAGVEVFVDVYAEAVDGDKPYCREPGEKPPAMTRWMAQAGALTIELADDGRGAYDGTLRLETVHLVGPEGGFAVVVPNIVIEHVPFRKP